jgi:hypothetical protein
MLSSFSILHHCMQPCPAVLPGSLARQPCPAALPGSLAEILQVSSLITPAELQALHNLLQDFPAINKTS